ncbi:CBS domain-containing protein [bacterium]|nr:MAG: CBS domain-containing protein [bacterium]
MAKTAKRVVTAKDVMKKKVITVTENLLAGELARLFEAKHISGAPVVDRAGHLVGVVSKSDLVRHECEGADLYKDSDEPLPKGFHVESPDRTTVADIMTPAVIEATEDAPASELAALMRKRRIHRVFITRQKRLRGIVTTLDLLKLLEA